MYALLTVASLLSSLLLNAPSPSALVSKKMLLYCKSEAAISTISNRGTLDQSYGLLFNDGFPEDQPNTSITSQSGAGRKTRSGTTYAYLTNNGGSSVTLNSPSPSTTISIDILVSTSIQDATADINLGSVTVPELYHDGTSLDYPDPTYDSRSVTITVNNLPPSQHTTDPANGTFSLIVTSP